MATAAALWSPLCGPADLAPQKGPNDAVSKSDTASTRSVGLPGHSEHLLCHAGKRPSEGNQCESFDSIQNKEMGELCGQLEELLVRARALGPSPLTPRPHLGGRTEHLSRSLAEGRDACDRTDQQIGRGSAGFGARIPLWSPAKKEIIDMNSYNAGNDRGQDEDCPASVAAQRTRGSPEIDHFFKAGQVCSRGDNCSFAHSVRELKPLLVPPFRRVHQTTPSRSSVASPAAQAAATYPPEATAHSQGTGGVAAAAARTMPAPAAADPAHESQYAKSTPASFIAHSGAWQAAGNFASKANSAPNSVDCAAASSYRAQQELISDLRRLSKATLECLLATVQEKGTASAVSAAASAAARVVAQEQQTSLRERGAETCSFPPLNVHALQRYLQQQPRSISPSGSTTSPPAGRSFVYQSPSLRECRLQQRQQELEGAITRLSVVQRPRGYQQPATCALTSLQQQNWEEEGGHSRFFQDLGVENIQREAPMMFLPTQHQQHVNRAAAPPIPAPLPCCSKKQQHEEQSFMTHAGAASLRQCEDNSWEKNGSLTVDNFWQARHHSNLPSICDNLGAQPSEKFPVSLAIEEDSLCQHLTAGRAVKKSRRGKRGGRKKRGAGHPVGGGGANQQEQVYLEQQQQRHQEDSIVGEKKQTKYHSSCAQRGCKYNSGDGGQDHLFVNLDPHEASKLLYQRVEGSTGSTFFSEGTPSTSAIGEICSPSGDATAPTLVPACSCTSGGGDSLFSLANPEKKNANSPQEGAQLLLETLHAHAATVGGNVRAGELAATAPSLLLSAAPTATTAVSPLSLLSTETLCRGKHLCAEKNKETASAFLSREGAKEVVPHHGHSCQLETTPQQILAEMLLQGGEKQQLLLQCVRDIMRQTPQAFSMSEIVSTLQLLSCGFNKHDQPVGTHDFPAAVAADAARKREENIAAAGGLEKNGGGLRAEGENHRLYMNMNFMENKSYLFPSQEGKNMFSSFSDFNFTLEKEKEGFDDRRSASVESTQRPGAGAAVASILELLADEEEDNTTTGSTMGQQQASTRSSSRCGVAKEEASGSLFGGSLPETTNFVSRGSVGNDTAATASTEYIPCLFSPSFPIAATTTSVCFSPWG